VFEAGDFVAIRLRVRAAQSVADFVFGVSVFNADGVCCFGTNTDIENMVSERLEGDAQIEFQMQRLSLVTGTYKLDVAVHRRDGAPYDYHRQLYTFRMTSRTRDVGIFKPEHRWMFSQNVHFK